MVALFDHFKFEDQAGSSKTKTNTTRIKHNSFSIEYLKIENFYQKYINQFGENALVYNYWNQKWRKKYLIKVKKLINNHHAILTKKPTIEKKSIDIQGHFCVSSQPHKYLTRNKSRCATRYARTKKLPVTQQKFFTNSIENGE